MNLLDGTTSNDIIAEATKEFLDKKRNHYKFSQLTQETRDEVIRKLRMTRLISFRGAGRFIDFNNLEIDKINHIIEIYANNIEKFESEEAYFNYMGRVDDKLMFHDEEKEGDLAYFRKESAIVAFANSHDWNFLKEQMRILTKRGEVKDPILRFIDGPARLEFLCAVVIKKKLPKVTVHAHYIADDEGIPYGTASGQRGDNVGADIDIYENTTHAIVEPTASNSRAFQVEHEIPSIKNHVIESKKKDVEEGNNYDEWFAIFIAPLLVVDVADEVAARKLINNVEIYPWNVDDFVEYTMENTFESIKEYKIIRDYMVPQRI